jgi:hypothetical protein
MARTRGSLEGKIETVLLQPLLIDESYQRGLKRHHTKIEGDFNPAAAGTLTVAWRGGDLYLVDGRQRRQAMLTLGIHKWRATVFHSTGPEYEAAIYRLLNDPRYRKGLTSKELFKALVVAKDPVALAVVAAAEGVGFVVHPSGGARKWPEIACVKTMYDIVDKYAKDPGSREVDLSRGQEVLRRALSIIHQAWAGQVEAVVDMIPWAMARLIGANATLDDGRMVNQLRQVPAGKVVADIKTSTKSRHLRAAEILAEIYNRKLGASSRLSLDPKGEAA